MLLGIVLRVSRVHICLTRTRPKPTLHDPFVLFLFFFLILVALSMLAAASYEEDKYGVVQHSLASIFTSLIRLQDVSFYTILVFLYRQSQY